MNTITFNGTEFETRTFKVIIENVEQTITISVQSLLDELDNFASEEEYEEIDNQIYFYLEDDEIDFAAKEICKECLDVKMEFIEELF